MKNVHFMKWRNCRWVVDNSNPAKAVSVSGVNLADKDIRMQIMQLENGYEIRLRSLCDTADALSKTWFRGAGAYITVKRQRNTIKFRTDCVIGAELGPIEANISWFAQEWPPARVHQHLV